MPKARAKQDDLTRRRRLNEGRCPIHGTGLMPMSLMVDNRYKVRCPRRDCRFEHSIIPGSKTDYAMRSVLRSVEDVEALLRSIYDRRERERLS